ncbi:glycoside hydrolase family 73 protein [Anseongella ginsenosidimutans]|uniref:glycoside hydrolase family 73 protein n=1 Tax=Anseongella ginsenosidimutans TaxID=496056 RepID=UPI0011C9F396|nr:glucosaminidase domain-containing protein [Anseongella ginsenosidimutans]QEC52035.1 hemagglutinin [Anseongella ginsenosidimutans]
MRWNLLLVVLLSLFLGACASKKHASSGKHRGKRPAAKAPERADHPGNRPSAAPSRSLDTEEYIRIYSSLAVAEMERSGIPASITLAQGILESGNGNSRLARQANNHFGIKCTSDWKGGKTYKDDDRRNECFRVYPSARDSYRDHSEFLKRQRYAFLFDLKPTDYKAWAHGLKKAGYATNPKYPQLLISLVERYELYYFDRPRDRKKEKVLATAPASGKDAPVKENASGAAAPPAGMPENASATAAETASASSEASAPAKEPEGMERSSAGGRPAKKPRNPKAFLIITIR